MSAHASRLVTIAIVHSTRLTDAEPMPVAWSEFTQQLSKPIINHAGLLHGEYLAAPPTVRKSQKDGVGWMPVELGGDLRRRKENVLRFTVAVLDIDDGFPMEETRERLAPYEHVGHTTYSHSLSKAKYRIVLLLATPVTPSEWRNLFDRLNDLLDGHADIGPGHNGAQFYFLPACPPDAQHLFQFYHNAGVLLDARDFNMEGRSV